MDMCGLLSRWRQSTPTGIDRVEMAYAEALALRASDRLSFGGLLPGGGYMRFPNAAVFDYLAATREAWTRGEGVSRRRYALRAMLGARPVIDVPAGRNRVYLHLSPRGLERPRVYEAALRSERARLVAFVHDLIPIQHREFVSEAAAARFKLRLAAVARLADGVLVNSRATALALAPHLVETGREISMRIAPLGTPLGAPLGASSTAPGQTRPYFVVLGTIEPRKNHLLLLHLWRRWVEQDGPEATPALVIIGRRGWENENILDLLDRSAALARVVDERSGLGDDETRALIRGARAVLCPSFAEGYGLPVAEALGLGAPVLASDIDAHREVGGPTADYLDPLDGPGWSAALRDYARPDSERRRRQMDRLARWRRPRWDDHFRTAFELIEEVAG